MLIVHRRRPSPSAMSKAQGGMWEKGLCIPTAKRKGGHGVPSFLHVHGGGAWDHWPTIASLAYEFLLSRCYEIAIDVSAL
jgi:hypothetical protein